MKQEFPPLLQRLTQLPSLTASDKKLIRYFEQTYPKIAFENLESISSSTALSTATVTRFVRKLGYANFYDFAHQLRAEVAQSFDAGPRVRFSLAQSHNDDSPYETLVRHTSESEQNLQRTLDQIDIASFDNTARLLSDSSRPLFLMGVSAGEAVMNYFHLLLRYFRSNITLLDCNTSTIAHKLADSDERSVLFALSIDRYSNVLYSIFSHFSSLGCETALMTNRRSSPFLQHTTYPIFVSTEGTSVFRTRSSSILILEALITAVSNLCKDTSQVRFERMEKVTNELQVFFRN